MGCCEKSNSQAALNVTQDTRSTDLDEEYEPHDHKPLGKSASYCETLSMLIKSSMGTGILGMPRAFYDAGYILGTLGTVYAGIMTTASVHFMAKSEHELCKRKRVARMTYPETAEAAFELGPGNLRRFKRIARVTCSASLVMMEFGGNCVYWIFIAENIKEICDRMFYPAALRFYLFCMLGPFILLCWIKNLKNLAPGATIGTSCAIGCICAIYCLIFSQPITFEGKKATGSLRDFALFFGTAIFALGAFAEIMPLKNSMTNSAKFSSAYGVINAAMIPITLLYLIMGVLGYLAYGENTRSPITLNMPQTGIVGTVIRGLLAGSIFMSYPIGNYVVIEELWHKNLKLKLKGIKHLDRWEYAFRTSVTCANLLCCITVPSMELVMALVGSLLFPVVGFWLPAILYMLTFWNEYTGIKFVLLMLTSSIFLLTGLFALLVSLSFTLLEIYEADL